MTARGRLTAFISGLAALAFALAILALARSQGGPEPPLAASRGLASVVLLAAPGLIGLLGAWTRRPTVVVAAGVLCLLQSVVAFSGVTLVYLLPAIGFLRAATDNGGPSSSRPRPVLLLLAAILAVPIAVAVVLLTGILGVLLLATVAGVAASRSRSGPRPGISTVGAALGVAIVILVVGAWLATFAATETTCWVGRTEPGGAMTWQQIPVTNTLMVPADATISTCASGQPTSAALVVASLLIAAALGVAALPFKRGRLDPAVGELSG
jgi:hypothetical protein